MSRNNSILAKHVSQCNDKNWNIYNSVIGDGTKIAHFVEIANSTIGNNCNIQAFVSISNGSYIGNNVFIGPGVRFLNDRYPPGNCERIIIEDNVVIGGGCILIAPLTISAGVKIAAGVTVKKDLPYKEGWYINDTETTKG